MAQANAGISGRAGAATTFQGKFYGTGFTKLIVTVPLVNLA